MAHLIADTLTAAGLNVWWDAQRLEGGAQFTAEIVEAIIRQYYFLFLLSGHSIKSPWCRRELARAVDLGKTIVSLKMDDIDAVETPLEIAGVQHISLQRGLPEALPALGRAVGLGLAETVAASDDPFSRDGRLLHAISEQVKYGESFTDSLNLIQLLSNIGVRCSATQRARQLFAGMCGPQNFRGSRIDYDRVAAFLIRGWQS